MEVNLDGFVMYKYKNINYYHIDHQILQSHNNKIQIFTIDTTEKNKLNKITLILLVEFWWLI